MDACLETNANEPIDPSIKYPPVILVGDSVPRDRQQLYNRAQKLCFWPVDTSNPNDANIQAIRRIILDAAINDPGFDIAQKVPISFLRAMDKLSAISEEVPILPIDSNDPEESCVMNVMHELGVFEDEEEDEQHKLEMCKAILRQYQSIGHFIYFDQEGLEDYCILDPQWLINMITYIVRDFKLHRFRRDFNAMDLNNGESWKALLNKSILEGSLLRKLWLDREHEGFLTELMLKLGIFGQLRCTSKDLTQNVYTVPTAISTSSQDAMIISIPKVEEYLGIDSLDKAVKELIDMSSCSYNLLSFYSRLVNRMISEWRNGYDLRKNPPQLISCGANLCLGSKYAFSILMNEKNAALEVYGDDCEKMAIIYNYVVEACNFVNTNYFHNRLQINLEYRKAKRAIYRKGNDEEEHATNVSVENTESITLHPNFQALVDFLLINKNLDFSISQQLARIIHKNDESVTPEELIDWYHEDKTVFQTEILRDLGITKSTDKSRIMKAIKFLPAPLEEVNYALIHLQNQKELAVADEGEAIRKKLKLSYFKCKVCKDFGEIHSELTEYQNYKIVHFGMHGSCIEKSSLDICLKGSSVKCVFLNVCNSESVADHLHDKVLTESVLFWSSKVDDTAAIVFSEAFYHYLSMKRREYSEKFEDAFKYAKEHIQLRNFVLIDPDHDWYIIEDKKRELARPDLVAAGIPVFYDRSKQESNDLEPPAIVEPENCKIMISFNNATSGKDAEDLCHFLNRNGTKTFCTRVFCPNNMGDWRTYTVTGANKCKILIALMTDGWQKSNECQFETDIIKNRFAKKEVTVIPVLYNSFDYEFDAEKKHFYRTTFGSYQGIPSKEKDEEWMESILKLLSP